MTATVSAGLDGRSACSPADWVDSTRPLLGVLALAGVATGALASMALFPGQEGSAAGGLVGSARPGRDEAAGVFHMAGRTVRKPDRHRPRAVKLEYFRRYQLDLQIAYYRTRRTDHRRSAERTAEYRCVGCRSGHVIASGTAGVLGAAVVTEWAALGSVAVSVPHCQAFAAAREAMNQDRRNAERYQRPGSARLPRTSGRRSAASPRDPRRCWWSMSPPCRISSLLSTGNGWKRRRARAGGGSTRQGSAERSSWGHGVR